MTRPGFVAAEPFGTPDRCDSGYGGDIERVPFLLRLDPEVMAALRRWASDDLRSLNSQMEFLLRRALVAERRLSSSSRRPGSDEGGRPAAG